MITSEDCIKILEIIYGTDVEEIETKLYVDHKTKTHVGKIYITVLGEEIESKKYNLLYKENNSKSLTREEEVREDEENRINLLRNYIIDLLKSKKNDNSI